MKKERVLVVENDPQYQRLLRAQLSAQGFVVQVTDRGEEALIAAAEIEPDMILLSMSLPGIDGLETCRRLREWTRTPIIVLDSPVSACFCQPTPPQAGAPRRNAPAYHHPAGRRLSVFRRAALRLNHAYPLEVRDEIDP
jgi:hypothetical protein